MYVLVDYDNIPQDVRRNGPRYVADRLCAALVRDAKNALMNDSRLDMRLYGGWYFKNSLSQVAQGLSASLQADFPFVITPGSGLPGRAITVAAGLAHALIVLPRHILYDTFRIRPADGTVACLHPSTIGCSEATCPMEVVFNFFDIQRCSRAGCQVTPAGLVRPRGEQKLVDTMLVADLLHLAHVREPAVTVVSSDDDLWPGIISCMHFGTHAIHVSTKHHHRQPSYLLGVTGKYSRATM